MNHQEFVTQVLQLTNDFRAQHDLEALTLNSELAQAAQTHSDNMAIQDFYSHTGLDDSSPGDRAIIAGHPHAYVGENIAAGYTTPEAVVQGWIDSPGHRGNMLNPEYNEIGIGYHYLENDTGAITYNHYWTQVFSLDLAAFYSPISAPTANTEFPETTNEDTSNGGNTTPDITPIDSTNFAEQVIQLTNEFRAENNLPPLTLNVDLTEAAQGHSDDMAYQDFFDHTGLDGSQPGDRATTAGYDYTYLGENIHTGSPTPAEVVQAWIDSPGHRANMLTSEYEHIGVGYTYLENDPGDWTYNHYWTQVFGQSTDSYIPPALDLPDDGENKSDEDDRNQIIGSTQNDKIDGSSKADLMLGGRGNDSLNGQDGDDILKGQHGNDQLKGGNGADTLLGGGGRDRLMGQNDDDILKGGGGDDLLKGGNGSDRLYAQGKGGQGDILIGQQGADKYYLHPKTIAIIRTFDALDGDTIHLGSKINHISLVEQGADIELLHGNKLVAIVEKSDINAVSESLIF